MLTSTIVLYAITWLAAAIISGPSMMMILANGFTRNKRLIVMGILGKSLGSMLIVTAVAIGLAP